MPILANARHEAFALNIAKGMSQEQAYIEAGYTKSSARQSASALMTNPNVIARVRELQAISASEAVVTASELSDQLEHIRKLALESGQLSAAVNATMGRAKLHGLIIDKAEVKDVTPPKIEEVDAKISQLLAKASDNIQQTAH